MRSERGSAMIIVMVILVALLGAGAVAIHLQVSDTKATGLIKAGRDSLYCAEAGLNYARPIVGEFFATWPEVLDGDDANNPDWYPIEADLDDDGELDFRVTLEDNDDERPPAVNDRTKDRDLRVFVVSECLKFPDTPRKVLELVSYRGGGTYYRNQAGQGSSNTGNIN